MSSTDNQRSCQCSWEELLSKHEEGNSDHKAKLPSCDAGTAGQLRPFVPENRHWSVDPSSDQHATFNSAKNDLPASFPDDTTQEDHRGKVRLRSWNTAGNHYKSGQQDALDRRQSDETQ